MERLFDNETYIGMSDDQPISDSAQPKRRRSRTTFVIFFGLAVCLIVSITAFAIVLKTTSKDERSAPEKKAKLAQFSATNQNFSKVLKVLSNEKQTEVDESGKLKKNLTEWLQNQELLEILVDSISDRIQELNDTILLKHSPKGLCFYLFT